MLLGSPCENPDRFCSGLREVTGFQHIFERETRAEVCACAFSQGEGTGVFRGTGSDCVRTIQQTWVFSVETPRIYRQAE